MPVGELQLCLLMPAVVPSGQPEQARSIITGNVNHRKGINWQHHVRRKVENKAPKVFTLNLLFPLD